MTTQCKHIEPTTTPRRLRNGNTHPYPRGTNAGEKNNQAKLEETDIPLIVALLQDGLGVAEVAEKFEVSISTIKRIKYGLTWKHITGGRVRDKTKYAWRTDR